MSKTIIFSTIYKKQNGQRVVVPGLRGEKGEKGQAGYDDAEGKKR